MRREQRTRLQESESGTDSSLLLCMWYLDDGYIIAKHHQLREAVAYLLSNKVKASALLLILSKCLVRWPKEPTESAKAAYPTELSQEYTEGTSILNAALGTHCMRHVGYHCDETQGIGAFYSKWLPLWKTRMSLSCF